MADVKKGGMLGAIDNLIGDQGFKTDLRISLTKATYFNLFATIASAMAVVIILMTISKAVLKAKV